MSIDTVEDQLIADALGWIESATSLDRDKIIPSAKGEEEQSVPTPDEPFVMFQYDPLNIPIGAQPEFSPRDAGGGEVDQTRIWQMRATLQLQGYGLETFKHLTDLQFRTHQTDLALQTVGSLEDLSELTQATDREARYALDFEAQYTLERVTETVSELKTVEIDSTFASPHESDDFQAPFVLNP